MKIKKFFAGIISCTMLFSLFTGCQSGGNTSTVPTEQIEQSAQTEQVLQTEKTNIARTADIAVIYTGDVHCAVDENIGYDGLSAYKKSLEADGCKVLLVDTGDAVQGGSIGSFSKGADIIALMNKLGYNAMTIGNHEFDYNGPDRVAELAEMADFPFLSLNFRKNNSDKSIYKDYVILDADGLKLAFVGVTTPKTLTESTPTFFMDQNGNYIYNFLGDETGDMLYSAVQKSVDAARGEGADYVIAMTHLGIDETSKPFMSSDLIANTNGIDVVLDGHSHSVIECERVKNKDGERVLLSSTGSRLQNIGLLCIEKDGNISTGLVSGYSEKDADITAMIADIKSKYEEKLKTVVGKLDYSLVTDDPQSGERIIRNVETNLGDFCADAYRDAADADIAIVNGGGIRASLNKGDVTYGNIVDVHPFGNLLCKKSVKGQAIIDALELSVSLFPEENGGFLQVSGLTFDVDANIPSSVKTDESGMFVSVDGERRVSNVMVNGAPIDADKFYTVVSSSYILKNAGNGYNMFNDSDMLMDEFMIDADALINYIGSSSYSADKYADPFGDGRINYINK